MTGGSSDAGEIVSGASVLGISTVWACTNLLAGTIGSLPLMVYKRRGDARVEAREHGLYRLLHDSPNYDQTALDFWEFMAASLELWGNAYARISRENGRVVGLTPISPDIVMVRRKANGDLEYTWSDNGRAYVETDRTVLHVRGFGGSPLGGMSTLQFARNAFGLAQAVDRSASAMFKNGLRPSGALKFQEFLTEEQRATAKAEMTDAYAGAMNAGRPFILEGGAEWVPFTINPDDAQMLESRRFSVEEVCRFFGVPPHMVGHTEKSSSWGTGLEQQTLAFQKFTLRRRLKRIEQALVKQLLTPAERGAGMTIEFNLEGLLRGDSAGRAAYYTAMTTIGAMTINDVCRLENLPLKPGGDVPRMQMQYVPITETPAKLEGDQ
ncbi:phage portal protein [Pseudooceanicola sp. C21-150M6]|uniref:phage portal protein n=1 Tax=Pseudooceanicola sp. C21-150M6 TaxID=3434355 RepID=UPI003D7FA96D